MDWVSTPVVRMTEVIATGEQKGLLYGYSYKHALSSEDVRSFSGELSSFFVGDWGFYRVDGDFDISKAVFLDSRSVSNDKYSNAFFEYAEYTDNNGNYLMLKYRKNINVTGKLQGDWREFKAENQKHILTCKTSAEACQFQVRNRVG